MMKTWFMEVDQIRSTEEVVATLYDDIAGAAEISESTSLTYHSDTLSLFEEMEHLLSTESSTVHSTNSTSLPQIPPQVTSESMQSKRKQRLVSREETNVTCATSKKRFYDMDPEDKTLNEKMRKKVLKAKKSKLFHDKRNEKLEKLEAENQILKSLLKRCGYTDTDIKISLENEKKYNESV